MEKQEKKEKAILTDNRMTTVNRRETSFEGLVSQLENGEDGIYNLINEDKNVIFYPKISITKKDLEEIQPLKQLKQAINMWETKLKTAQGKDAYIIKKTLIELRKDQYLIKTAYRKPITFNKITKTNNIPALPEEKITITPEGEIEAKGMSFLNPKVCQAFLCNYSKIKEDSWGNFSGDLWYLIYDFDKLCEKALADYPIYNQIITYKIDGKSNLEIQKCLIEEFEKTYSIEYISNLWRKKIPEIIAAKAQDDYLLYYYTNVEIGKFKFCRRCGQTKLALPRYFSRNAASKDGLYSICKKCRSRKEEY